MDVSLLKKIPPKFRKLPFTRAKASQWGISTFHLRKMLSDGHIERLSRGLYRIPQQDMNEEDMFCSATLRVGGPSAICLISALVHYNLADAIPKKTWIMVPVTKRTRYPDLKVFRMRNPKWKIGIEQHKGYAMTSIERTLVDALAYRSAIGSKIGIEALKQAISENKTTLRKIADMAKKLNTLHRILSYIEAFS